MKFIFTLYLIYLILDAIDNNSVSGNYIGIVGKSVSIGCNTSLWGENAISLILWYKGAKNVPIYSIDSRTTSLANSKHIQSGSRYKLNVSTLPPQLIIDPIMESDEGEYRCRVDYKNERTQRYATFLEIMVPPKNMIIMDQDGQVLDGLAGPFNEGTSLALTCQTMGGRPTPILSWWSNGHLVDNSYNHGALGIIRNTLKISSLNRSDLLTNLECRASNDNQTVLLTKSITLDLNLKPLDIRLTKLTRPLSSGNKAELECLTYGSKPDAQLTWWKGSKRLTNAREKMSTDTNVTISKLSFIATTEDNGRYISCRAENSAFNSSPIEDGFNLLVNYLPQLTINLGANIKRDSIREDNDVFLECSVKSNPPVSEILWTFEGEPLRSNISQGIIASNHSLVIQRVKRIHRGYYRCIARNTEGQSTSDPFFLRVKYSPICKLNQKFTYATARNELTTVTCEMDADPMDLQFKWKLNTTSISHVIDNFSSNGSMSTLPYIAKNRHSYGLLLCSAENEIGPVREPCMFQLIPAGPPDKVSNCISNHSMSTLFIECLPGDDNGLTQSFHVEVFYGFSRNLERNLTNSKKPAFLLTDLIPGSTYTLSIYSSNGKGRSHVYRLVATTLGEPEKQMSQESMDQVTFSPIFVILIGFVAILVIISIIIILFLRKRSDRSDSINGQVETHVISDHSNTLNSIVTQPLNGPKTRKLKDVQSAYDIEFDKLML
ncbi:hemicentin-1-like [Panonychus citri]|uniref:hemicentin-1-like n=1 Tax=Panonychus citri TaxID=50023 RepID=UPI0023076A97|nr:hemicentin-1-like [Panonychus citri]